MATKKAPYVKGSKGSKPTPLAIPSKPVSFSHTQDQSMFTGNKKAGK